MANALFETAASTAASDGLTLLPTAVAFTA